jgi:hypothetical protein
MKIKLSRTVKQLRNVYCLEYFKMPSAIRKTLTNEFIN